MASLDLQDLGKSYGGMPVVRDCRLQVRDGEFIVLVGPSGCGKSTLLRCVAGLEDITAGRLLIDGVDMTRADPVARGVAMVFQSYALYPHMTVAQNIGFGLKIAGADAGSIDARVREVAGLLHLETLLSRKPRALSGGQRQRVAIGRALARRPRLFLFDEPLSNLDASLRAEMRVELARLHQALGTTMIYVTHDQVEAMTLATRLVVMNAGIIEQAGAPLDLFNAPATRFVAAFLGQPPMNFLRASPGAGDVLALPGGAVIKLPAAVNPAGGRAVEFGIRPEHLRLGDGPGAVSFAVDVVEQLGSDTLLYGRLADGQALTARLPGQVPVRVGDLVRLTVDPDRLVAFDTSGANLSAPRTAGTR